MPSALSFEEAAAIPLAAQTALQALRDLARVRAGDHVCINGASGGVGVFALQIAKALGASVTSVSSARNLEFCRRLGADEALDYAAEDPFSGSRSYRVVLDAFGNRRFDQVRASLGPGGVFVTTVPSRRIIVDALRTIFGYPRARLVAVRSRAADLHVLAQLVEAGRLRAVIDRIVDFDAVVDAIRFLESRRARGKVVVRMP
jgi:NADPH:quinone reductase-like Zn-dependent oxidoreductase